MSLTEFLTALFDSGRLRVPREIALDDDDVRAAQRVLGDAALVDRQEAPGSPPPLDADAATWAAERVYRACGFVVHRDLGASGIERALAPPFAGVRTPAAHGSVDLTFRYLPQIIERTRRTAESDPLLSHLRTLAAAWPLSSVGVPELPPPGADTVEEIAADPSLLARYADRILERDDGSRTGPPAVRDAVLAALGDHHELAPRVAASLGATRAGEQR